MGPQTNPRPKQSPLFVGLYSQAHQLTSQPAHQPAIRVMKFPHSHRQRFNLTNPAGSPPFRLAALSLSAATLPQLGPHSMPLSWPLSLSSLAHLPTGTPTLKQLHLGANFLQSIPMSFCSFCSRGRHLGRCKISAGGHFVCAPHHCCTAAELPMIYSVCVCVRVSLRLRLRLGHTLKLSPNSGQLSDLSTAELRARKCPSLCPMLFARPKLRHLVSQPPGPQETLARTLKASRDCSFRRAQTVLRNGGGQNGEMGGREENQTAERWTRLD